MKPIKMEIPKSVVEISQPDIVVPVSNSFVCTVPAFWDITSIDGKISARCTRSDETFEGSAEEFNIRMRG